MITSKHKLSKHVIDLKDRPVEEHWYGNRLMVDGIQPIAGTKITSNLNLKSKKRAKNIWHKLIGGNNG